MDEHITDGELAEIEDRERNSSTGPWRSWVEGRDGESGDSFIMIGAGESRQADMYITRDDGIGSVADLDFIAHAKQDIPRLIEEIKRLKGKI